MGAQALMEDMLGQDDWCWCWGRGVRGQSHESRRGTGFIVGAETMSQRMWLVGVNGRWTIKAESRRFDIDLKAQVAVYSMSIDLILAKTSSASVVALGRPSGARLKRTIGKL
jgi:hypothetical protein